MDIERALLGKALHAGQLEDLVTRGIEVDHFSSGECREVFDSALDHLRKYQVPPSVDAMRDEHPDFVMELTTDSTDFLIDKFVNQVKRRKAIQLGEAYAEAIEDPDQVGNIEEVAMEMATTLMEIVPQPRIGRYSESDERREEYNRKKEAGEEEIWGLKMGVPSIDNLTMGLKPSELGVVVAWQGVGKSLFMQNWAWNMYLQDRTPLYISLEMSKEELYERWDAMAMTVEHHALISCTLPDADVERWEEVAQKARETRAERDILVIDDLGSCTPDRVLAETRRYQPDAVFVDYLELMDSPRNNDQGWREIDMIGRDLKRNARVLKTPVVVAAQTNIGDGGQGPTLSNISYKSTGKHANIMIGLHRDEEMEARKKMEVRLLKNRRGRGRTTTEMHWNPEIMEFREKTLADYARSRQEAGMTSQ